MHGVDEVHQSEGLPGVLSLHRGADRQAAIPPAQCGGRLQETRLCAAMPLR